MSLLAFMDRVQAEGIERDDNFYVIEVFCSHCNTSFKNPFSIKCPRERAESSVSQLVCLNCRTLGGCRL